MNLKLSNGTEEPAFLTVTHIERIKLSEWAAQHQMRVQSSSELKGEVLKTITAPLSYHWHYDKLPALDPTLPFHYLVTCKVDTGD